PLMSIPPPKSTPFPYTTLFRSGLKAGETLLIHGATSGIGVTAIQMAKAAGATVIATSRGPEKAAAARALGADISLDARSDDLARSEEHTSELQSRENLVCRLLL